LAEKHHKVRESLRSAMCGSEAHIEPIRAIEGMAWEEAGRHVPGVAHTIHELLNHMIYWQNWTIQWLDGNDPPLPEHAHLSWPGGERPKNESDWEGTIRTFLEGLRQLDRRCLECELLRVQERWTPVQMLVSVALHNSYHLGQIVSTRRLMGIWPPPSGGNTW
jgi:uncharacterized damage-inducible protein DinB